MSDRSMDSDDVTDNQGADTLDRLFAESTASSCGEEIDRDELHDREKNSPVRNT